MKKIAVVHDYFTQRGGAERVAEELFAMFPTSDLFSTVALSEMLPPEIPRAKIRTSWMQLLPKMDKYYRLYFPIYPLGVKSLNLKDYDLVVSSSCGYAKGVETRADAIHISYCHTPMRWVWRYDDYAERANIGKGTRSALPAFLGALRVWDRNASRQPDQFVANSKVVAQRIEQVYQRQAIVIPPPIDVRRFHTSTQQDDYFLILSRLIPYKRIDLAIEACNSLDQQLVVIGSGPDRKRLEAMAGPTIKFLGRLSYEQINQYLSVCQALILPGEEDFGMVPLEAASAGRPTIAFRGGGATETVVEGVTGLFFDSPDAKSLAAAIQNFRNYHWSAEVLRQHAEKFDVEAFRQQFHQLLNSIGVTLTTAEFAASRSSSLSATA